MNPKSVGKWGVVAAGVLAAGAGGAWAASDAHWSAAAGDVGLRLYAWALQMGQQLPLAFLIPVVALCVSFHAGSRLAGCVRPRARAAAASRPPIARYAILFVTMSFMSLLYAVSRGLFN